MRKFIFSLIKFLPIPILLTLIIGFGIHSYTQYCFERGKKLPENIKTIFIGDSQFETGINPAFYEHSFSCSKSALQYKYVLAKLKYYTEQNDIDTAFVTLAYHSIFHVIDDTVKVVPRESLEQELSYNMPFIMNDEELYKSFKEKDRFTFLKYKWLYKLGIPTKPLLIELINTLQSHDYSLKCVKGGFVSHSQNHVTKDDFMKRFNGEKVLSGKLELMKQNVFFLQRIMSYCNEKDIVLYFVNTPLHKNLYEYYAILHNPTDSVVNDMISKYNNVKYLNFSNIEFPEKGFKDHNHLNNFGAEVFTTLLRDSVAGLQKR